MQITSPSPLAAPAPVNPVQPSDNSQRESRFANLLRQNQAAAPAQPRVAQKAAEPAPAPATQPDDAGASDQPEAPDTNSAPTTAAKLRSRLADKSAPPKRAEPAPKPAGESSKSTASEDQPSTERARDPATTASLDPWLATLQRSAEAPTLPSGTRSPGPTTGDRADTGAVSETPDGNATDTSMTGTGATRDTRAASPGARKAARDTGEHATALPLPAPAADPLAALQAAGRGGDDRAQPMRNEPVVQAPGVFIPQTAASAETAAPVVVHLPTPLASPEFAQALGVQMSVFASGGVQQAELHLNPAEMGPVSVQIVIDGTQAQVDFGADHAATRHAIESGLPELAGALRDAGFTLTGGGVSQHSGGSGDGRGGNAGQPGARTRSIEASGSAADAGPHRVVRRAISAGGVDLYA